MKNNIHSLPNADTSKAKIEAIKRGLPEMMQIQPILAELRMVSYKAHIAQGFTEDQALALCSKLSG